jgi:hypothetical protein
MTGIDLQVGSVATIMIAPERLSLADTCAPAALVIRVVDPETDTEMYGVAVVDRQGTALLELGPFPGEDAVAIWRSLAARSGLPLLIRGHDGRLHETAEQIGSIQLGPVRIRRGKALLTGRRPRFLVRRKTGRLPRRPLVYREREMAAGTWR